MLLIIGGLYRIEHNKSDEAMMMPTNYSHQTGSNGLPSKPEERWRYIKELENRQLGVQDQTTATASKLPSASPLTTEQRQLLAQMQADMPREKKQRNNVHYHDKHQKVGKTTPTPITTQGPHNNFTRQPVHAPPQVTPPTIVKLPQFQPVQKSAEVGMTQGKQRWLLECGSFQTLDQADSVRAQLAFAGIESRITTGAGWNRILLGPYTSDAGIMKILQNLGAAGGVNCIPVTARG